MSDQITQLLSALSLEEKAALCSGADFWHLKSIERLGIPPIMVTDGPHGLRKQASDPSNPNLSRSVPGTCFPPAAASACSWDRELMRAIGRALGEECQQEEVAVILGPAVNIKRSPLCGRNFEYMSEDPYLASEMAAGWIEGVQSQGVGASLKHYAVNNQEHRRMTINAVVDARALREIYLANFEGAVRKAQPWTVMCAYNRLNGVFCSENTWLLTDVLRGEWGFEGLVMTDWGATNDRVEGVKAGLDLEMPSSHGLNDALLVKAVREGRLDEQILDRVARRVLELIFKGVENRKTGFRYDPEAHHALARRAAAESAVLLKNEDGTLPLKKDMKIALIGMFAQNPRYQGGGSSHINPTRLDTTFDELTRQGIAFTYAAGYDLKSDTPDEALIAEACAAARGVDAAVIIAGLPEHDETEGADRQHLRMPESHTVLIQRVAAVNPRTVVYLMNGSAVEMPWIDSVPAVVEGFLGGQAAGSAAVDVLFGDVNPCGKLAETLPLRLEDTPAFQYFPGGPKTVEYRESLFVGYRYYDSARKPVLFPFGHGLSYTRFEYRDLQVSLARLKEGEELTVSLLVKNSGERAGAEVVQLYVRDVESTAFRPEKELKGFEKVFLQPGEEQRVSFTLGARAFAYYNPLIADWHIESGAFELLAGASSADICARACVWVESARPDAPLPDLRHDAPVYHHLPQGGLQVSDAEFRALYGAELPPNQNSPAEPFTRNTTLGDLRSNPMGQMIYEQTRQLMLQSFDGTDNETMRVMVEKMVEEMPLRGLVMFGGGMFTFEMADGLLAQMNAMEGRG